MRDKLYNVVGIDYEGYFYDDVIRWIERHYGENAANRFSEYILGKKMGKKDGRDIVYAKDVYAFIDEEDD